MGVYLRDHPPVRSQYRSPRRATPSGVVVVHTAESVLDTVGPDTGAEGVAAFIQRRSDAGSYHDLVDSDSGIQLVEYGDEAYQDGTGSNPHALSISFALSAADWPRLSAARRSAFLHQGALAFARQQAWLRAHGYPTTPLRRITRAQSDARVPGFISHAERDPARRTDPGPGFPWAEWFDHCRTIAEGDDDMPLTVEDAQLVARILLDTHAPDHTGGKPLRVRYLLHSTLDHAAAAARDAAVARALAEESSRTGRALTDDEIDRIASAVAADVDAAQAADIAAQLTITTKEN